MTTYLVDTNVLLRFLLKSDQKSYLAAKKKFGQAKDKKIKIVIPSEVIPEIVYVLNSVYQIPRDEITNKLKHLLKISYLDCDYRKTWIKVLDIYQKIKVDCVDIFLVVKAREQQMKVLSFDHDVKRVADVYDELYGD